MNKIFYIINLILYILNKAISNKMYAQSDKYINLKI